MRTDKPKPKVTIHGIATSYDYGCRCEHCRLAHRIKNKRDRRRRYRSAIPDNVEHGESAYRNWGCRCQVCRTGNAEASRRKREKNRREKTSMDSTE